jgi:Zn finger protein HypA/HybF involved in hydrogenase expression
MEVVALHRTLEQELLALARGISLECLVCGEFVLREGDRLQCPECGSVVRRAVGSSASQLEFDVQAG